MTRPDPYATVEEADAYLANRGDAAVWASAPLAAKSAMLMHASDAIDRQLLKGAKLTTTQARAFPRRTTFITQSETPQRVKDACCEEANALLGQLGSPRLSLQRQGVSSASFDGSAETFREAAGHRLLSVVARELLKYDLAGPV